MIGLQKSLPLLALGVIFAAGCGDSGDPKPVEGVVIEHHMEGEHDHHTGHGEHTHGSSSMSYSSLPTSNINPEGSLQDHGLTPTIPRPPEKLSDI